MARRRRREPTRPSCAGCTTPTGPEILVHMLDVVHSMARGITEEQTARFLVAGAADRWLAELEEILQQAQAVRKCDELHRLQAPRPGPDVWLRRQLEGLGE